MKSFKFKILGGFILASLLAVSSAAAQDQTRVPYLEARALSHSKSLGRADIQRQLVLLSAQSRLTPSWPAVYRRIAEVSLKIGRGDLADRALRKYHSLQTNSVMAQLELIDLELRGLANAEGRRQYLTAKLNQKDLLPEVISDIYRQLAWISWQNYETDRAQKFLDLSIRRVPQNLAAYELLRRIVRSDKTATPIRELEIRAGELQGRLMNNPFDAHAAIELAIVSGKAGEPDRMRFWLDYGHRLKSIDAPLAAWPIDLRLELAESFLAIGEPGRAAEILKSILAHGPSTAPATTPATILPAEDTDISTLLHARILLAIAAKQIDDTKIVSQQHDHLIRFANTVLLRKQGPTAGILLTAIYLTLYADRPDYLKATSLAKIARETSPEDSMTAIGLALPLAISGEVTQSEQLLKQADEPNHPLVLLAESFIESSRKNTDGVREKLTACAWNTPFGPLRDAIASAAARLNLPEPPEPAVSNLRQRLDPFDSRYLAIAGGKDSIGKLTLNTRGNLSRGQIVDLNIAFTNRTEVPLAVGPGSLIHPFFVLEFKAEGSAPGDKPLIQFIHYIPIEARQILEPGKMIRADEVLNAIEGWDQWIIERDQSITRITVQAALITPIPAGNPATITLAKSPPLTLDLPVLNRANTALLIARLSKPIINDPWNAAQLVRWTFMKPDLDDQHPALIDAVLGQLSAGSPDSTRAAFIWALQSAKPEDKVVNALAGELQSPQWLVRLMAVDTLGQLQGKDAEKIFEYYAANDCDELVRRLCAGYLLKILSEFP